MSTCLSNLTDQRSEVSFHEIQLLVTVARFATRYKGSGSGTYARRKRYVI